MRPSEPQPHAETPQPSARAGEPEKLPAIEVTSPRSMPRDVALDALRGLAVLLMVAAGRLPYDAANSLPAWMYHAQEPPPSHTFNPHLPGLTWVDLVFPTFLFALGASVPLAYTRRIERENSSSGVIVHTLQRGLLLAWFAIYRNDLDPYTIQSEPDRRTWALALLGFALLFPMFTRLPEGWSAIRKALIRLIGFGGGVALLYALYGHADRKFSLDNSDIILIVLSNMVVFGALIWLCTRGRPMARLGIMGLVVASRLASGSPGWVQDFYHATRLPFPPRWDYSWLLQPDFQKYLLVVLPGTIVGDLLLGWRREQAAETEEAAPGRRWIAAASVSVGLVIALLAGLEARWLRSTTLLVWALCGGAVWLTARPADATQRLLHALCRWGSYWVVLGLTLEPFEGGIKKDSATLSYLFLTPGIACYLLSALLTLTALYRHRRAVSLLADVGQNPMIGYVGLQTLVLPVAALTGLDVKLSEWFVSPWMVALRATLETLALAYFVRLCSRLKLYWRT